MNKSSDSVLSSVSSSAIGEAQQALKKMHPSVAPIRIERGVAKTASLWNGNDGSDSVFVEFCKTRFVGNEAELDELFLKLSRGYEVLFGHFSLMGMRLNEPLDLVGGSVTPIDEMFGGYSPSAHLYEDLYSNKIAFVTSLNFPAYTLAEKSVQGKSWSRKQWAYARMGDLFEARVPSSIRMQYAQASSRADSYISSYNIMMGRLTDHDKQTFFPADMVLLSHWNLRDEIKSNYADKKSGLQKQRIIQQVMTRIIDQTIPVEVINDARYTWNPFTNEVIDGDRGSVVKTEEGVRRYQQMKDLFTLLQSSDAYYDDLDTYIKRKFDGEMEISQEDVESLFIEFLSSPLKQQVGRLIEARIGRPLEPFDIWYDGFKQRSEISADTLNRVTMSRFPNAQAMKDRLPTILEQLRFSPDRAAQIASRIEVDAARGSGHARGALMKGDNAHLRTRIGERGMDYKGFNIAIHELGHNVEQTISLYDVDYYMLNGVPNTSFTEALAFMFQSRDLPLLYIFRGNRESERMKVLDDYWSLYEIMGVSLVDMRIWKWMYANPSATADELKHAMLRVAKEVWNEFYAPVFGQKDVTLLAVYSHLVSYPLYMSAYSFGHIIDFQLEAYIKNRHFATEIDRIFRIGRLTPNAWMQQAVGEDISIQPILKATESALVAPPPPVRRRVEESVAPITPEEN